MVKKSLQKYYSRLVKEGLLKSLLYGGFIGFCVLTLLGGVYWFMGWQSVWVCYVAWLVVTCASVYAFYRFKFKPTTKDIARRVDELGLDERIVTMTEFEEDQSVIAKIQRQNALEALDKVQPNSLKIALSKSSILSVTVSAFVGICLGVFALLCALGIVPSIKDILANSNPNVDGKTYTITYGIQNGLGVIQGAVEQKVKEGEDSIGVAAVASDGWTFVRWSDGSTDPFRQETGVNKDMTFLAVFTEINAGLVGELDEDYPKDAPGDAQSTEPPSSDEYGDEVAGKYEEVNQVIDGQTYYGNIYDEHYKEAMEKLEGSEYSQDEKDVGSGYFDNIEKEAEEGSD